MNNQKAFDSSFAHSVTLALFVFVLVELCLNKTLALRHPVGFRPPILTDIDTTA